MSRTTSRLFVVGMVAVLVFAGGTAAYAKSWKTKDTDSLNRTVPSGKAYTTGSSITWQDEDVRGQFPDARAKFTATLRLDGSKNSCAWLRVITYKNNGFKRAQSKRFPASSSTNFGYYAYCQADGAGAKTYTGVDDLDIGAVNNYNDIDQAKVSICYTASKSRAPSGDCYNFTVNKGD